LGWRVSEEGFYKNSPVSGILDNLKLRVSYGMMGIRVREIMVPGAISTDITMIQEARCSMEV
jgi:hypothetical protein